MAAISSPLPWCHFLHTYHYLHLFIYLAGHKRGLLPTYYLLESYRHIWRLRRSTLFFSTTSPNKGWLREVEAKYILIWDSHIMLATELQRCIFLLTAQLSRPRADGRKSCHCWPFFSFNLPSFTSSCQHIYPPPLSPSSASSVPLGYELNLIDDLFCLACLPLAMFVKRCNVNASCLRETWRAMLWLGKHWFVRGVFWGWVVLDLATCSTVNQPELESSDSQGGMMAKALKRLFISS